MSDRELRQADPPVLGGVDTSADAAAISRGSGGFSNDGVPMHTAWHGVTGTDADDNGEIDDLNHLRWMLDTSPEVEGAINQGVLLRLRAVLSEVPTHTKYHQPVSIPVGDAYMLAKLMLKRLK